MLDEDNLYAPAGLLPPAALKWFTRELEKTLKTSTKRVSIFCREMKNQKTSGKHLRSLAVTVCMGHGQMVASIDKQIEYYLSLEFTKQQQLILKRCQNIAQQLHKIQALFELADPFASPTFH
jgi:hypothetical protein